MKLFTQSVADSLIGEIQVDVSIFDFKILYLFQTYLFYIFLTCLEIIRPFCEIGFDHINWLLTIFDKSNVL